MKAEKLSLREATKKMVKALMKEDLCRIMLQALELGFLSSRLSCHQASNRSRSRPCNKI